MALCCCDKIGDFLEKIIELDDQGKPLSLKDILPLPDHSDPIPGARELQKAFFEEEVPSAKRENREPSFRRAVWSLYKLDLIYAVFMRTIYEAASIATPFVLREVINWLDQDDSETVAGVQQLEGYGLAIALAAVIFVLLYSLAVSIEHTMTRLQKLSGSIMISLYEKMLRLRNDTAQAKSGSILTLTLTEAHTIKLNFFLASVFAAPFAIVANVVALFFLVDWPGLLSIAVLAIFMIIQMLMTSHSVEYRSRYLRAAEVRLRRVAEIISGIKLTKLMGWEVPFENVVKKLRKTETDSLVSLISFRTLIISSAHLLPQVLQLTIFSVVFAVFTNQKASAAFPVTVLVNSLRVAVASFSLNMNRFFDMLLSFDRFRDFLLMEERIPYVEFDKQQEQQEKEQEHQEGEKEEEKENKQQEKEYSLSMSSPVRFGAVINPAAMKEAKAIASNNVDDIEEKEKSEKKQQQINNNNKDSTTQEEEEEMKKFENREPEENEKQKKDQAQKIPMNDGTENLFLPLTHEPIQLSFKKGTLTAIIGGTGKTGGKSSILNGLCGEAELEPSSSSASSSSPDIKTTSKEKEKFFPVHHHESVALASQEPWVLNATLRENIVMAAASDQSPSEPIIYNENNVDIDRYARALHCCQLIPDLEVLPAGDLTEVGASGVNLSGGQQSRSSLARAVYSNRETVIMDDVLSAVDPHVAKNIFDSCIVEELKGRTRLLVTHSTQFLPSCDRIILVHQQKIAFDGNYLEYEEFQKEKEKSSASSAAAASASSLARTKISSKESIIASSTQSIDEMNESETSSPSSPSLPTTGNSNKISSSSSKRKKSAMSFDELLQHVHSAFLLQKGVDGKTDFNEKQQDNSNNNDENEKNDENNENDDVEKGRLIEKEHIVTGSATWSAYYWYIENGGICFGIIIMFMFFLWRSSISVSDMVLSLWTTQVFKTQDNTTTTTSAAPSSSSSSLSITSSEQFMALFGIFIAVSAVAVVLRAIIYTVFVNAAASRIHETLFDVIINAPMSYFDTTANGKILSNFSKDTESVDVVIPEEAFFTISIAVNTAGLIITIMIGSVYLIPVVLILLFFYEHARRRFTAGLRNLRRLEDYVRTPCASQLSQTLSGLKSIRTYGLSEHFTQRFRHAVKDMIQVSDSYRNMNFWVLSRMASIGTAIVLFMGIVSVIIRVVPQLSEAVIDKSFSALSLTYSCTAALNLSYAAMTLATLSTYFSACERVKYTIENTPQEIDVKYGDDENDEYGGDNKNVNNNNEPFQENSSSSSTSLQITTSESKENNNKEPQKQQQQQQQQQRHRVVKALSSSFPEHGEIEFKNVYLRYRPNLPLVLKNVSFKIPSGKKIGVVGRSGSGKSTLISALFRLVDVEQGSIYLSGRNIRDLTLTDLRKNISIVSQDVMLFSGTVRSNIDPFNLYQDDELWRAIEISGGNLKDRLQKKHQKRKNEEQDQKEEKEEQQQQEEEEEDDTGLGTIIEEYGNNLSKGERQCLCLARATLKRARFLVLDEATSSVSHEIDAMVQKVIRSEFAHCTIITIAHRIQTILDYDLILVMSEGCVVEFSTPKELLDDVNSQFYAMVCKQYGGAEHIHEAIEIVENSRN